MKKSKNKFRYIYGPVSSWRLGNSLGVDLLSSNEKICSFDCIYCQLGRTKKYEIKRKLYVPTSKIINEIKALPKTQIDYITFSGRGDPTLARNLGEAIAAIKKIRKEPIAVLTNSSLLYRKDVRKELCLADLVAVKLDADSEKFLKIVNCPAKSIKFNAILNGIKQFRKEYRGKLALQIMLIHANKSIAKNIAKLAEAINPDELQICSSRRSVNLKALDKKTILQMQRYFRRLNTSSFYTTKRKKTKPINLKSTKYRRGPGIQ